MNQLANELMRTIVTMSLLLQLSYFKSMLAVLTFLREHPRLLRVTAWLMVLWPYILFLILLWCVAFLGATWFWETRL